MESESAPNWQQKPHRFTVDIPEPLVPLIKARKNSVPYESVNKYIFWTLVYEITLRKPHRFTPWLMRQSEERQQEFFEELIRTFDDTTNTPGSWMESRIREEAISLITSGEVDDLVLERADKIRAKRRKKP